MRIYDDNTERLNGTAGTGEKLFDYANQRAERAIAAALWRYAPDVLIASEHGDDVAIVGSEMVDQPAWLVEPLHGAGEFARGTGGFTINIALIERSTPVLGVVYAPDRGVLYAGEVETGAVRAEVDWNYWMDDYRTEPIEVLERAVALPQGRHYPDRFRLLIPRGRKSRELQDYIRDRRKDEPELEADATAGPLRFCAVAEGTAEEAITLSSTMEWTTAAGHAVAQAAGCRVCVWRGGFSLLYNKEARENPPFVVTGAFVSAPKDSLG